MTSYTVQLHILKFGYIQDVYTFRQHEAGQTFAKQLGEKVLLHRTGLFLKEGECIPDIHCPNKPYSHCTVWGYEML